MATDISVLYSQRYRNALDLLSQQQDSRFEATVQKETGVGKTHWYDAIGQTSAQQIVGRYQDTPNNDYDHQRTRIDLAGYNTGKMLDSIDALETLHDPRSKYVMAADMAMKRKKDDVIIAAFFASSVRGETGGTTTAFPSANQIAVDSWAYGAGSGNAGLTVSKLISARLALKAAEVDLDVEEPYIAVTAKQEGNLLATTEVTSGDYNSQLTLVDGKIDRFMGFRFIHSERLPLNASSYRRCPVWVRSGMFLAVGKDIMSQVAQRADKNFNWQVYHEMYLGAARVEDAKVIEVICSEA